MSQTQEKIHKLSIGVKIMDITEIKAKRDKLESNLFDLVYHFTEETGVAPYGIDLNWIRVEMVGEKHHARQLIDCTVKIEI